MVEIDAQNWPHVDCEMQHKPGRWNQSWPSQARRRKAASRYSRQGHCFFRRLGRSPHIPNAKVALAWFALGNLDFPRTPGIWHPLVRCLSRPTSTGKKEFLGDDFVSTTPCTWQSLVLCLSRCSPEKHRNPDLTEMSSVSVSALSAYAWNVSGYKFVSVHGGVSLHEGGPRHGGL